MNTLSKRTENSVKSKLSKAALLLAEATALVEQETEASPKGTIVEGQYGIRFCIRFGGKNDAYIISHLSSLPYWNVR